MDMSTDVQILGKIYFQEKSQAEIKENFFGGRGPPNCTENSGTARSHKRCPVPNLCHLKPIAGPYRQK